MSLRENRRFRTVLISFINDEEQRVTEKFKNFEDGTLEPTHVCGDGVVITLEDLCKPIIMNQ